MGSPSVSGRDDSGPDPQDVEAKDVEAHEPPGVLAPLARVFGLFLLLTIWAAVVAIAYAYGGDAGLLGWVRLPEGLDPFLQLNLAMADVVAYAALFVAILLASTVQLNSTVAGADAIADKRPTSPQEARAQQRDLRSFATQAELALLVSFGAAFSVLLMTILFGFAEIAANVQASEVDTEGVGWGAFFEAAPGFAHPRIVFMYIVSLLLFVTTFASMPEWKNTGLFQRQVEDNAWQARERLALIASEHDLRNVAAVRRAPGMRAAAIAGYVVYFCAFALILNLSLALFAGDEGFRGVFAAGQLPLFLAFALIAALLSNGVGGVMLRVFHLHGRSNAFSVISIALLFAAVLFIVWAEGVGWVVGMALVMAAYLALWVFLYWRGASVLDEKNPATWEFFVNPPKYAVVRRYEAIRRSADVLRERGLAAGKDVVRTVAKPETGPGAGSTAPHEGERS